VTGLIGDFTSGMLMSGWVFFICTDPEGFGGSGKMLMRAVSFLGPGDGAEGGSAIGSGARRADAAWVEAPGAEKAGVDDGGRKAGTDGATGGGGEAGAGGRGNPPFEGGRAGRLIRTVSRGVETGGALEAARGGSVMRTVSFFGSFGSVICNLAFTKKVPKNRPFVTG
jgi:hypothetical protein